MAENYLKLKEAAEFLGVSPITLRKWDREGKLTAIRIGSRNDRRYVKADLEKFVAGELTKIDWQEYIRNGVVYRITLPVLKAMNEGQKKYFGRGINYLINYFSHGMLYWYYEANDLYKMGHTITDKLTREPDFAQEFFELWVKYGESLKKLTDKYPAEVLKQMSPKELSEISKKYYQLQEEFYSVAICIDATDESLMLDLSRMIKDAAKAKLGEAYTEKEFAALYAGLTAPEELSIVTQEERDILNVAIQARKKNFLKEQILEAVEPLVKKYWWTHLGWERGSAKTAIEFMTEVEEQLTQTDLDQKYHRLNTYTEETVAHKSVLIKKYSLEESEILPLLAINEKLTYFHDYRKEVQMISNFWEYQLLEEIARRSGISQRLLDWAEPDEIYRAAKGEEIDYYALNHRDDQFLLAYVAGKEVKLSGKTAERKYYELVKVDNSIRDLNGMTAYGGTVIGEAYVALSSHQAKHIKPGQILITSMTTPDFVPAMRIAAAIITDEGGMTCHAAIISRELGKPCLVGTKYATKIFQTGDKVELRASHGVARKL